MPDNKRHHYVPQFYLRNFSKSGKSISLYNVKNRIFIPQAAIKTQCYKNHYYGEDGKLENVLAGLEGTISQLLKKIIFTSYCPTKNEAEFNNYFALIIFTILQHGRTEKAEIELNDFFDSFYKEIFKHKFTEKELEKFQIKITNAQITNVKNYITSAPLLLDLDLRIIQNKTKIPFIASDSPVIFFNQFCQDIKDMSNTGFSCSGLQIFFPLSPCTLLFYFDPQIYRPKNRKRSIIKIEDEASINTINELQVLGCIENIYSERNFLENFFPNLHMNAIRRKKPKLAYSETFPQISKGIFGKGEPLVNEKGETSSLIKVSKVSLPIKINPSFCSIRKGSGKLPLEERVNKSRNQKIEELMMELMQQMDQKKINSVKHLWLQAVAQSKNH